MICGQCRCMIGSRAYGVLAWHRYQEGSKGKDWKTFAHMASLCKGLICSGLKEESCHMLVMLDVNNRDDL